MRPSRLIPVLLASLLSACAPSAPDQASEDATSAEDELASSVSAQLGPLKLTVQSEAGFEERGGKRVLVIRGSANRNLTQVFSFVPDDAFAQASLLTQRKFEIVFTEGYEINTLLSGLPILLSVQTATGTPQSFVARIRIATELARFSGSSKVFLHEDIDPIFVRDEQNNLRYRGVASVTGGASDLTVGSTAGPSAAVTRVDAGTFTFDFKFDDLRQVADETSDRIIATAATSTGARTKKAAVEAVVTSVDLTTDDPYVVWAADCEPEVLSCLDALPRDQYDLSQCGSYRQVNKCIRELTP